MTKQTRPQPRTAAQAGREFYADPAMRLAAQAMRYGDGVPSHSGVEAQAARSARRAVAPQQQRRVPGTAGVRVSRQARAALAGRPVRPLPTRTARRVRRAERRIVRRLGIAAIFAFLALALGVLLIPAVAALGIAAAVGAGTLAYIK